MVEAHGAGVRFEIGDDGHGFDPTLDGHGSGLQNITDRIEALGGHVRIVTGWTGPRICGELGAECQAAALPGAVHDP